MEKWVHGGEQQQGIDNNNQTIPQQTQINTNTPQPNSIPSNIPSPIRVSTVMFNWKASTQGQIDLVQGDTVNIFHVYENGWAFGSNSNGSSGYFPYSFVSH